MSEKEESEKEHFSCDCFFHLSAFLRAKNSSNSTASEHCTDHIYIEVSLLTFMSDKNDKKLQQFFLHSFAEIITIVIKKEEEEEGKTKHPKSVSTKCLLLVTYTHYTLHTANIIHVWQKAAERKTQNHIDKLNDYPYSRLLHGTKQCAHNFLQYMAGFCSFGFFPCVSVIHVYVYKTSDKMPNSKHHDRSSGKKTHIGMCLCEIMS